MAITIPDERVIRQKDVDCKILDIQPPLFVCAPMVRYSRNAFRKLVRRYNCDLAYTPMIYAENYARSEQCRAVEFAVADDDYPIVQFAARKASDFADVAELIYGRASGLDLNCGCPKRDVRSEGLGSKLLDNPALIADIVRQTRARISDPDFSVSTKIRIQYPIELTVDLCRQIEAAGVSHIAVHARTVKQRDEAPDLEAVRLIKSALAVPVFANGGCKSYNQALEMAQITGADGIMAAEGLLANPALFAGHTQTPDICVRDWIELARDIDVPFTNFHRHLSFMFRPLLKKSQRSKLDSCKTIDSAEDYFSAYFDETKAVNSS